VLSTAAGCDGAAGTARPRPAYSARQDQFVPEVEELIDLDVATNVIVGSLAEDLLVDPKPVVAPREVVHLRRPAPADVQGKFHPPVGLLD